MLDGVQERGVRVETILATGQSGGKVQAEAVEAAIECPGAECVHTKPEHGGAVHGQDIAAAGVVYISRSVGCEAIVGGVVEATHRQGWTKFIALT